jgi:signal transduction histidine kinase
LGSRATVLVALAAGGAHTIPTLLGRAEPLVQPIAQTVLFVGVGLATAKLAEWQLTAGARATRSKGQPGDWLESSFNEVKDASQMSALGRVVVGLVRQFRTPVASIEGAGWVLQDSRLPDEKRQEFVGIVRKESHRLNRVLSDVLDFTQPRRPRFQKIELSKLVDEVIQLAGPRDHGPFFLFHKDIPPNLPLLRCDPDQIRQVLLNLVMNAIQASPGGGLIEISAHVKDAGVIIKVKDHGRGIPPATLDRIFDPFFTTHENSLGLGLPVALRIVTEHGGKIAVDPTSDKETCFSVVLPVDPAAASVRLDNASK